VDNKGILDVLPDVKQLDKMRVTGLTLGTTSITLTTTTQKGRVASSYPRLILILLPGATYQVQWKGGPPICEEVIFTTMLRNHSNELQILRPYRVEFQNQTSHCYKYRWNCLYLYF